MFKFFGNKKKPQKGLKHLKNSINLAKIPGVIKPGTLNYLYHLGKRFKIDSSKIDNFIAENSPNPIPEVSRFRSSLQMESLIKILVLNNTFTKAEYDFCFEIIKNLKTTKRDFLVKLEEARLENEANLRLNKSKSHLSVA